MDTHETRYRELSAFHEGKVDVFLTTYEDEKYVDSSLIFSKDKKYSDLSTPADLHLMYTSNFPDTLTG